MQDTIMYDLNRYLAEESRAQAREERLEAIATEIRSDALKALAAGNEEVASDVWSFIDEDALKKLMCRMAAGKRDTILAELASIFTSSVDDHVMYEAENELKHLEEVEAEDRALAGVY